MRMKMLQWPSQSPNFAFTERLNKQRHVGRQIELNKVMKQVKMFLLTECFLILT